MRHRSAFTLVELSIVLVILGLLVGGVLAGQSLIHASELRAVGQEYTQYKTAMNAFREKYFAIPGDMPNATAFWGAAATCPSDASTAAAGVCNGDANGQVMQNDTTNGGSREQYGFWEHLAYAGLIEGTYTGSSDQGGFDEGGGRGGVNVPTSKFNKGLWHIFSIGIVTLPSSSFFEGSYGNALYFGGFVDNSSIPNAPIMTASDAWNIDSKMDDGKPATGSIRGSEEFALAANNPAGCSNPATAATSLAASTYTLANTANTCVLIFTTGY